jgi:hypothetical protein
VAVVVGEGTFWANLSDVGSMPVPPFIVRPIRLMWPDFRLIDSKLPFCPPTSRRSIPTHPSRSLGLATLLVSLSFSSIFSRRVL